MTNETKPTELERSRQVATAASVATLETCSTCPFCGTCVRHAPNTCNRYDGHLLQRARVRSMTRRFYLDKSEVELLAVLEIGFVPYLGPQRTQSETKL